MSEQFGYTKVIENKIVRIRHIITFNEGYFAASLTSLIGKVPGNAQLVDIDYDDDPENGYKTSLIFIEEKEDK